MGFLKRIESFLEPTPRIDQLEPTPVTRYLGVLCAFLFFLVFVFPYYTGITRKDNRVIGFATATNGKKNFTISEVLNSSNKIFQIILVYSFVQFSGIFLGFQNFYADDLRIIVPLAAYCFGLFMIINLATDYLKYPTLHKILAGFIFISGTLYGIAVYYIYDSFDVFSEDDLFGLRWTSSILVVLSLFLIGMILFSYSVPSLKIFGKQIATIDIFAAFEVIHICVVMVSVFVLSTMPALPDMNMSGEEIIPNTKKYGF